MKILVFSDSHGDVSNMVDVTERVQPDRVFHLGDHIRDAEELSYAFPELTVDSVPGNCDWRSRAPLTKKLTLEGVCILLCHGHEFGVKTSYGALAQYARSEGAKVALCGHTHHSYLGKKMGVGLCNPGSCGMGIVPTYGILTLEGGTWDFRVYPVYEEEA